MVPNRELLRVAAADLGILRSVRLEGDVAAAQEGVTVEVLLDGTRRQFQQGEKDAGFILACQARPTSDKLVLDFDTA